MKFRFLKYLLIFQLLLGISLAGDLRVNIINGTLDEPGTADRVVLVDMAAGMVEIAAAEDVVKSTTFSDVSSTGQSQYLIRATLDGVSYSTMFVPPSEVTAWEISLTVYESASTVHDVNASVPFFVIYGFEDQLYIQNRLVLENVAAPPVTFVDSPGLINVHIPESVSDLEYLTFKSASMPVKTALTVDSNNGQVLPNPIKPGVSEIDMAYYMPYNPEGTPLNELVSYDIDHFHLYVMPVSLNVTAQGLVREGTDNENGLAIYAFENVKAGTMLEFQVSGRGMSESDQNENQQNRQTSGKIVVENRIDQNVELAFAGVLVMVILISLFISITQQSHNLKQESIEMLINQKTDLLKQYAKLDKLSSDNDEKDRVLYRLVSVYKTLDRIK